MSVEIGLCVRMYTFDDFLTAADFINRLFVCMYKYITYEYMHMHVCIYAWSVNFDKCTAEVHMNTYMHTNMDRWIYVCVNINTHTHTHTHTHIYIYIYIDGYMHACMCVCMDV